MRILVYEFVTGGGAHAWGVEPEGPLLDEGRAMVEAVARDWAALPDAEVHLAWDDRLPRDASLDVRFRSVASADQERSLLESSADFDGVLVIAPELEEGLIERVDWIERAGGTLYGPGSETVAIGSDKRKTDAILRAGERPDDRVRAIPCIDWDSPAFGNGAGRGEWIVKPIDGVGGDRVVLVSEFRQALDLVAPELRARYVLQRFVHGRPASVAALGGPSPVVLPPCTQTIRWKKGHAVYCGGETLADLADIDAAHDAMRFVLKKLPPFVGYLGVDLILTDEGPRIVEINPRPTTSYVGIRAAIDESLADLTLRVASGQTVPPPLPRRRVRYDTRGAVTLLD